MHYLNLVITFCTLNPAFAWVLTVLACQFVFRRLERFTRSN